MNCPTCRSPLKERRAQKGPMFLVCSQCKFAGTPELLELLEKALQEKREAAPPLKPPDPEPVKLGSFVTQLAQLRIHQAKLKSAKTSEEREAIRIRAVRVMDGE